ncbi:MAG: Rpn family recombination-promoting nuclease/putative transposase [Bacteroidia bacterium]
MAEQVPEKYINPFTDFGFKKLFGTEANKDLLLSFLNELLHEEAGVIVDLHYKQTEHLGSTEIDRKAIFDVYCENDKGQRFIIEMQKVKQAFFKDRSICYTTFPIQEQAKKEDWNYELQGVFMVGVLDFRFDDEYKTAVKVSEQEIEISPLLRKNAKIKPIKTLLSDAVIHRVMLMDVDRKTIFYKKLMYVYLQMPNFNLPLEALQTNKDKWFYLLKHLAGMQEMPIGFDADIFRKVFEISEIAKFNENENERLSYIQSKKYYLDMKNSLDTAFEEGIEEGLLKGKQIGIEEGRKLERQANELRFHNMVWVLHENGLDSEKISEITQIPLGQVAIILQNRSQNSSHENTL